MIVPGLYQNCTRIVPRSYQDCTRIVPGLYQDRPPMSHCTASITLYCFTVWFNSTRLCQNTNSSPIAVELTYTLSLLPSTAVPREAIHCTHNSSTLSLCYLGSETETQNSPNTSISIILSSHIQLLIVLPPFLFVWT